jgi:hypothetical protein
VDPEVRHSGKGLAGTSALIALLLVVTMNGAYAAPTPLALTATGGVVDLGAQTYNVSGGVFVYGYVDGHLVDPATAVLSFSISAQVVGLSTSGTASFSLAGTADVGGTNESVTADGQIQIIAEYNATTIGTSELPLFFVGGSNTTVTINGGAPSVTTPVFDLESPYFNPWGAPIVIAAEDNSTVIVATYSVGTILWQGTETLGAVNGTLGGSAVTGSLTIVSQENEDLVAGTAADSGTIALTGMSPASLDVSGTYTGTSTIPTAGEADCSPDLGFPASSPGAGVCTQTGFQSSGQATMQNSQFRVTGTYSTVWGVPALGYSSTLTFSYDSIPDPIVCSPAEIHATPGQLPTIGLNGPSWLSTPNATNTVDFFVTQPDAVPAKWLAGGCISQDASSFTQLNVTRVAFSVDGGALQDANLSFFKHGEFACYVSGSMTIMDDWHSCAGSISVVQVWTGSVTFTVLPTGIHSLDLFAWGQGGVGPFKTSLAVEHSLVSYSGQPFTIAASGLAGMPVVVNCAGLEPMLTAKGTVMIPVNETYRTVVPPSGLISGSFVANGHVTVVSESPADSWGFILGDSPASPQQLTISP